MTLSKIEQDCANDLARSMYERMIEELTGFDLTKPDGYGHEDVFGIISALVREAENRLRMPRHGAIKHEAVRQMFDRLCEEFRIISRIDKSATRIYFACDDRLLTVLTDYLNGQAVSVYNTNPFAQVAAMARTNGSAGAEGNPQ